MPYSLVKVEWMDACGGEQQGWRPLSQVAETRPTPAISVGYLLCADEESIVICPHLVHTNTDCPEGDGEIAIPRDWVTRIIDLTEDATYITLDVQ